MAGATMPLLYAAAPQKTEVVVIGLISTWATSFAWHAPQTCRATRRSPGFTKRMNLGSSLLRSVQDCWGFAEEYRLSGPFHASGKRGWTCALRVASSYAGVPRSTPCGTTISGEPP